MQADKAGSIQQIISTGTVSYVLLVTEDGQQKDKDGKRASISWELIALSNTNGGATLFVSSKIHLSKREKFVRLVFKDGSVYAVFSASIHKVDGGDGRLLFSHQQFKYVVYASSEFALPQLLPQ